MLVRVFTTAIMIMINAVSVSVSVMIVIVTRMLMFMGILRGRQSRTMEDWSWSTCARAHSYSDLDHYVSGRVYNLYTTCRIASARW